MKITYCFEALAIRPRSAYFVLLCFTERRAIYYLLPQRFLKVYLSRIIQVLVDRFMYALQWIGCVLNCSAQMYLCGLSSNMFPISQSIVGIAR